MELSSLVSIAINIHYNIYFIQGINPIIAKKMIEERSKDYSTAKRVAREFDVQNKGIVRSIPSVPPQNTAEELKQVCEFKNLLAT